VAKMLKVLIKRLDDFYQKNANTEEKRLLIDEIFKESGTIQELIQQLDKVETQIKELTCKKCWGSGKVDDKYIDVQSADWPWDNYYTKKPCPACKGAGVQLLKRES